jgi:glycosyltransferase involved in cell wall biosynthesis
MSTNEEASWEALIVDNDSSDDTKAVIESFLEKYPFRFRYLFEKRRGKSLALNAGIQAATGKLLAFTDDDCVVDPNWVIEMVRQFSLDPTLGVIGGRVEPGNSGDQGLTVRRSRQRSLLLSVDQLYSLILGCNMVFARRVIDEVGLFDPDVGPGALIESGNDIDILYRAFKRGIKIAYEPSILVYHNHGRVAESEVFAIRKNYAVGRGAFYCQQILAGERDVLRMAYWEIVSLLKNSARGIVAGRESREDVGFLWALMIGVGKRMMLQLVSTVKEVRKAGQVERGAVEGCCELQTPPKDAGNL